MVRELEASVRGAGGFGSTGSFRFAASNGVVVGATAPSADTATATAL